MTTEARLFWEALPIIAALAAIFFCSYRALVTSKRSTRIASALSVVCALMMLAAQVSWSWSFFVQGSLLGTEMANLLWTSFNSLVMATFIYASYWADKNA